MSAAFQAITVVGGVVPPSLLGRIQAGEVNDARSMAPASFHLAGTETVRDAASRTWMYLQGAWSAWRESDAAKRPDGHGAGTGDARQKWLLVLLRELGYGQVPATPGGLTIGSEAYPISHRWESVPIHLLGPGVDLDKRTPKVEGAARRAPQAMMQEFLNREDTYLWAILSNGLRLRLLRDSTALAGSAYIEFDLETIFESDLYSEFQLFWQLCHQSRLDKRGGSEAPPSDCWLELWRDESVEAGARALDKLGAGVERALGFLGTGFLRHPDNRWLVDALHSGDLSHRDFHKALLRAAYRLLFLFVVEDRGALLDPAATTEARHRYATYFSTQRLRKMSRSRDGGPHPDLWRTQKLVLGALGGDGLGVIGLPALGGLFDPDPRAARLAGQPHGDLLLGAELANQDFLKAIRGLGWVAGKTGRLQPVDYRHLGAEELGSVYESLLELVPRVDTETRSFELAHLAGNERKTTGSYYTPPSLVSALLDTALDPLLDQAVNGATGPDAAEARLLALTVCDPASGSGGFLVAAARRIARRLAEVRAGDNEPTPGEVQSALHDVVERCIYGVDMNDLAAELAKVSLWLEAMQPGKPLGFLDARIKIGNSLLGTTPALLAGGVPDGAFGVLEGDDSKYAAEVRKRNKAENSRNKAGGRFVHGGQEAFSLERPSTPFAELISKRQEMLKPVYTAAEARSRAKAYAVFEHSPDMEQKRLHADAWCAAFVWPLTAGVAEPPTSSVVRQFGDAGYEAGYTDTINMVRQLADEYRFFHWHLEFPEIFGDPEMAEVGDDGLPGGFSCILGNPPWEQVKVEEISYFASRSPSISAAVNSAVRKKLIKSLESEDPILWAEYLRHRRYSSGEAHFLTKSNRFPLGSVGDLNTYAVFSELSMNLVDPQGRMGLVIQSGLLSGFTYRAFAEYLIGHKRLVSFYGFENEAKLFPGITNKVKFGLLVISGRNRPIEQADYVANARYVDDLLEAARHYTLSRDDILRINPNSATVPNFRWKQDAELMKRIHHSSMPLMDLKNEINPWDVEIKSMFHMSGASEHFLFDADVSPFIKGWDGAVAVTVDGARLYPLLEGKMIWLFDHRYGTYDGQTAEQSNKGVLPHVGDADHENPNFRVKPRYWVAEELVDNTGWWSPHAEYGMAFRDVGPAERTLTPCLVPKCAAGDKAPLLKSSYKGTPFAAFLALWCSLVVDYSARQRGSFMKQYVVEQTPVLPPYELEVDVPFMGESAMTWLGRRSLELSYTSWDMKPFASDCNETGSPFVWDSSRRNVIQAEIDAGVMHLFKLSRSDVDWVLESFTVLKKNEVREFGIFRTKEMVLASFDAMQQAMETGSAFQSTLTPPPGQGPRHPAKEFFA